MARADEVTREVGSEAEGIQSVQTSKLVPVLVLARLLWAPEVHVWVVGPCPRSDACVGRVGGPHVPSPPLFSRVSSHLVCTQD